MEPTRPRRGETDEDLLRMQEEFLAAQAKPAAKVVRVGDKRKQTETQPPSAAKRDVVSLSGDLGGPAPGFPSASAEIPQPQRAKKSKFKERNEGKVQWPGAPLPSTFEDQDPEEMMDKHDHHITKILSEIVEKDTSAFPVYFPDAPNPGSVGGFPDVFRRELGNPLQKKSAGKDKKRSIFAQQIAEKKQREQAVKFEDSVKDEAMDVEASCSFTLAKKDLKEDIHQENLAKMEAMSEEEILAEQEKLLKMLDPNLVSFLKGRKSVAPGTPKHEDGKASDKRPPTKGKSDTKKSVTFSETPETKTDTTANVPINVDKKWVNMNKIEYEKLEWMSDISVDNANVETGKAARFDFQGNTVSTDKDIPVHEGLHHHGEDQDRAGYTLQELFQLARSANMQQRCLALNTLARILVNARSGKFSGCLSSPVIPNLLDAGIPFLARWALDDSTDNTMVSAVHVIHSLLVCEQDEEAADKVFYWYRGCEMPRMRAPEPERSEEEEEEEQQLKDADIVKQDLIKGFFRMSLLQRLRYILEMWKPDAYVVLQILDILIRIARHSTQAAYEIFQCPRLLDVIFQNFIPPGFDPSRNSSTVAYGRPVGRAMKLIRVICSAGRHMAGSILSKYNMMETIGRYVVAAASDFSPSVEKDSDVQLESWRLWVTVSKYGKGEVLFRDFYSVLMEKLQTLCHTTPSSPPGMQHELISLVSVYETMTTVAARATSAFQARLQSQSDEEQMIPDLNWSQVNGLEQPLRVCLSKHLNHFTVSHFEKQFELGILASCLNYFATYYQNVSSQPGENILLHLENIEDISSKFVLPCLKSQSFTAAMTSIRDHSMLVNDLVTDRKENTPSLPELGSLVNEDGMFCPVLSEQSSINCVVALVRLLVSIGKVHKEIPGKMYEVVLTHEETLQYVRKVCKTGRLRTCYFTKWETTLLHQLLQMARTCPQKTGIDYKLYHQLALKLLVTLEQGSEHEAHELISTVLFNEIFIDDAQPESGGLSSLESLQIAESHPLTSATAEQIQTSKMDLLKDVSASFTEMKTTYLQTMSGMVAGLVQSRSRALGMCQEVRDLFTGDVAETLVPVDWAFFPLLDLYSKTFDMDAPGTSSHTTSPADTAVVRNALKWVYFLESYRPSALGNVSLPIKLTRVMCTFLSGNDLFLDKGVHSYLVGLLQLYCTPALLDRMDFDVKIPGLPSFHDFYLAFLDQYEAVSFGDSLFGCYLLLPLQQKHNVDLRRAVWGEHAILLRSLTIPIKELIIPVERFLEPEEDNVSLLNMYYRALHTGEVHPKRSPLLYLIAVHHINRFIYNQSKTNARLKKAMLKQIDLKKHLIYYKRFDPESSHGIGMFDELPKIRQLHLETASQ